LRADHLSAYGYKKLRTPHIDSFAQGGTLFAQAEAQVPLTLPSHTSLFTSTYPFENQMEENGERVPTGMVTLASVLKARGYQTAAFIGSEFLDRRYGLDQGFNVYDSPFGGEATAVTNPLAMSLRRDGALVVRAARQWLNGHKGKPVFVFVHLFDLHVPYTLLPEVARRKGISRYDAQLEYVDQVMGRFQDVLKQDGWWDKSLVVVFGDHGEGLGDHQETDHGYYVYESTLHVPLIVHWPTVAETRNSKLEIRNSKPGSRNSEFGSGNLKLALVGLTVGARKSELETKDSMRDLDLRNPESGIRSALRAASFLSPSLAGGDSPQGSSSPLPISPQSGRVSNFDFRISNAPVGLIDVAPTILDYLRVPAPPSFEGQSLLGAIKVGETAAPRPVYSESLYAHDAFRWAPLRALRVGKYKYIQAPKAELYDLDADPREQVNLMPRNGAMAAELQNQLTRLRARYAPTQRSTPPASSPETIAELESLGYLAAQPRRDRGGTGDDLTAPDPKDRFAEFTRYQNAFVALTEGHAAASLPAFQSIVSQDPQNTLARFHLGECYLQLKMPQVALREWTTVLKLDPEYAPAAESIGEYWLAQGDYDKARRRFQQVLALSPDSFAGHYQLSVADEHLGLLPEARKHLEIACKINPHDEECAQKLNSPAPK
jgi:arylsulfatase A-like enzyme/Tfp pilus assembly protein PilF